MATRRRGPGFVRGAGPLVRAARFALHRAPVRDLGRRLDRQQRGGAARAGLARRPARVGRRAGAAALRRAALHGPRRARRPASRRSIRPRRCRTRRRSGRRSRRSSTTPRLEPWLDSAPQTNEVGRSAVLMSGLAGRGGPLRPADAALRARRERRASTCCSTAIATISAGWRRANRESADPAQARMGGPAAARRGCADRRPRRRRPQPGPPAAGRGAAARLSLAGPARAARPARGGARHRRRASAARRQGRRRRLDRGQSRRRAGARCGARGDALGRLPIFRRRRAGAGRARISRRPARRPQSGAPLAWLRFEKEPDADRYALRLRTWPGGEALLAWTHPHGSKVTLVNALISHPNYCESVIIAFAPVRR